MGFGVLGLDDLEGIESCYPSMVSDSDPKQKGHGSAYLKQLRSGFVEDDWRSLKMAKNFDFVASKSMFQQQEQLISFSSPKSEPLLLSDHGLVNPTTLPYYHHYTCSSPCVKNTGLDVEMHGARGPFTPSQWMELEHQALIYKYMNSNVPVPSNLLIPIKKALNPSQFSGSLKPNSVQWGSFDLGFSSRNMDPEPGRCHRTDGKKWRCSRDAVVEQKYCERHINRGRHRSRKPVEGHSGHFASGKRKTHNLTISQQPIKTDVDRIFVNKGDVVDRTQEHYNLSMLSSSVNLKPKDTPLFSISKERIPFEEASQMEYGLITSSNLHHFIDSWPKDQSNPMSSSWLDIEEAQSNRTQLSISIPAASSDFSSASSLTNENFETSPLKLSHEFDPMQMDLGVSNFLNKGTPRQANRVPILWEASMGGPLGEALSKINNTPIDFKDSFSAIDLSIKKPTIGGLSPTGVLQRPSFGSFSNSSTGSSPRTENNRTSEKASQCDDFLGSALANSASSIASL